MKNIFIILLVLLFSSISYALTFEQREMYRFEEEEQYHRHKLIKREVIFEGQILAMRIYLTRRAYNPSGVSYYSYRPTTSHYRRSSYSYSSYRYRRRNREPQYYGGLIPYF